ncbi:MAG: hypothetical protein SVK08_01550 [Halobacteriota archaeon]|nr:hypothetical protein [Halobacteriota archaeon]
MRHSKGKKLSIKEEKFTRKKGTTEVYIASTPDYYNEYHAMKDMISGAPAYYFRRVKLKRSWYGRLVPVIADDKIWEPVPCEFDLIKGKKNIMYILRKDRENEKKVDQ